jgi:acyl-CoA synthetase (AMP-forming)/AMP-acid ligase II
MELSAGDPAFLQYTGGTTGLPKGALLTHGNLLASVRQFGAWLQCRQTEELFLSGFPMFHIAGLFVALISLHYGYAQTLVPNPRDTELIIKQINALKPTLMANVPSLWLLLLDNPEFATADFSRLKVAITAASPIPEEKMRELESILGANKISEFYGMTECSPIISLNPIIGRKKPRSVGLPVPSTWVRIVDLGLGDKDVALGEVGELVVSGPQVMKGYHNQPQETAGVLRERDGRLWMRTGDVGRMDADGYLYLVDRSKDMVNVSGYKVFPRELEEKIFTHPAIASCAVVGVPDPARPGNEMVKLVAILSPEAQARPEDEVRAELTAFLRGEVAPYKVPKIIEFRPEIPLTSVGKVDKKALR